MVSQKYEEFEFILNFAQSSSPFHVFCWQKHTSLKKYTNAGVGGGDKHQLKMMKPYLTTGSEGDDEGRD